MEKKVQMELSLKELNILYYALSMHEMEVKSNYRKYGGEFFETELNTTSQLIDKTSDKLYTLAKNEE